MSPNFSMRGEIQVERGGFVLKFLGVRLTYPVGNGRCMGDDSPWNLPERELCYGNGDLFGWKGADMWG